MNNRVLTPISASPKVVFDVICDFSSYPNWNPFTPEVLGECAVGQIVRVRVRLGGEPFWMKRRIVAADREAGFSWEGAEWYSLVAPGARTILCEDDGQGGTLLIDDERVGGLAFAMPASVKSAIPRQMQAFAAGLKAFVEAPPVLEPLRAR